jgi:hypothetical protein
MDLLKAKIYLDKISREFARMSKDPENVARIDVDITLSYIRELYDAFLSEKPAAAPAVTPRKPAPAPEPVAAPAPPPPPIVVAAPAPPPPVLAEVPAPAPPPAPVVVAPPPAPVAAPAPPPPPVVVEVPAPPVVVEAPAPPPAPARSTGAAVSTEEASVVFEQKEAKELSEKLSELPISDLKRAIALNDRLLLTRELFGGDGPAFDATLSALNSFSGFEQAKAHLIAECIGQYGWLDKNRLDAAKNFVKLVRRRYK